MKLVKNIIIEGKMELLTGMHIGGNKGTLEIGGIDSYVIRNADGEPYIPGSSLKGKMRALVELKNGHIKEDGSHKDKCEDRECPICLVFGRPGNMNMKVGPSRMIVRDLHLTPESWENLKENPELVKGTETKTENAINRLTSQAKPRTFERVPKGAEFDFNIVLSIYEGDDVKELLETVHQGMALLLDNYLGGMGTRGYGRVGFKDMKVTIRTVDDYENGNDGEKKKISDISELLDLT